MSNGVITFSFTDVEMCLLFSDAVGVLLPMGWWWNCIPLCVKTGTFSQAVPDCAVMRKVCLVFIMLFPSFSLCCSGVHCPSEEVGVSTISSPASPPVSSGWGGLPPTTAWTGSRSRCLERHRRRHLGGCLPSEGASGSAFTARWAPLSLSAGEFVRCVGKSSFRVKLACT